MGIYELLGSVADVRKGSNACDFNGYLEDYLDTLEEDSNILPALKALFEIDNDSRVIVNLRTGVSKDSISNQIIRYKDIFKLENEAIVSPYIIYTKKEEQEKALLLVNDEYIYAKGIYYCLTEPSGAFQDVKNDIVAIDDRNVEEVCDTYKKMFTKRAGQIQRELDSTRFKDYDASYEHALEISNAISENLFDNLKTVENKDRFIRECICKWFLIKKFVYVQYMVNKNILNTRHEGNVKAQRNQAKQNADSIRFVSIAEMRKGSKENIA